MKHVATCLAVWCALMGVAMSARADEPIQFNRDIRPILSENCFYCHGNDPENRKAHMRLDDPASFLKKGRVIPGDPAHSKLIKHINATDPDDIMPPPKTHKKLSAKQKKLLERWIAEGAPFQVHWAYAPITRPPVPPLADRSEVVNPIDAFVQAELVKRHVKPAPEADRRTLIRRLSLDLIGIPPTPDEVEDFLADTGPNAYEKLVDRLLASPHYGERMADAWLDLARYADSVGFHGDQYQNAWPYRDWVIDAYNRNMPFDEFTTDQLAGDLLPHPTQKQMIASCFNRLNMMTREGGAQAKEYLVKYTIDRIRTVGTTWLGSTLGCCQCHDHKFDPFTQHDFYSLGAFFGDLKQWGIYADYRYTPNPDLRGYNNNSPFPPEMIVDSPALQRRRAAALRQIDAFADTTAPKPADLENWKQAVTDFLHKNPDGWQSLPPVSKPEVKSPATPPAKSDLKHHTAKPAPKHHAKPAPKPEPLTVDAQNRIRFEGTQGADDLTFQPGAMHLAAVRLELLPDPTRDNSIRRGRADRVSFTFERVDHAGKTHNLSVRYAAANLYLPAGYSAGHEVFSAAGVASGWRIGEDENDKPHTAVFFLRSPAVFAAGDTLRLKISTNSFALIRVSVSPIVPLAIDSVDLPVAAGTLTTNPQHLRLLYLRSTGWDAKALAELEKLDKNVIATRGGRTPVMVSETAKHPLEVRLLQRGNWTTPVGPPLKPATPAFLPKLPGSEGRTLTRLDLAKWFCIPENPLTARVVMNRIWYRFLGTGLSTQIEDLGAQGEPPSNPALLDWLATEFRESGWNVKHMVKLLVMSHTYRQASGPRADLEEIDPNNRLYACQNPRRLDAEFIRDNALAIAGLLSPEIGGPPAHPYQPAGYLSGLQFPGRRWKTDEGQGQYRRGMYIFWQRTFLHPMLVNFDAPSREDCIAQRIVSNSPQQALTLLNDPEFVEAARVFAAHLLAQPARDDAARIDRAYERALARPARPDEVRGLVDVLGQLRRQYIQHPEDAAKIQHVGISPPATGDPVEQAAWTGVCRVILNLHETITRY